MSSLTVNISIDPSAINNFQGSKYVLCLSKSIQNDNHETSGNVIFATIPYDQLGPSMKFTWIEKYQVYEKTTVASTEVYPIDQGQTANFKPDGTAKVTGPSLPDQPFVVANNWKDWSRFGVKVFNTTEAPGTFRTFYISEANPLTAEADLRPIKKYQIFWATGVTIETEIPRNEDNLIGITETHTGPYTIDLTESDSINLTYRNGTWARI